MSSKLDLLCNKSLYLVALNLAQSEQVDLHLLAWPKAEHSSHARLRRGATAVLHAVLLA